MLQHLKKDEASLIPQVILITQMVAEMMKKTQKCRRRSGQNPGKQ